MKIVLATLSVAALAGLLVSALPAPATGPVRAAAPETYAVDNGHSSVVFRTLHMGVAEFYGRFNQIVESESRVVLDGDKSSIVVTIDAASVDTNSSDRDQHLRSPDFFNAKEFPAMVFESKSVKGSGEQWEVEGDLTFRGVTKPISAKARKVGAGEMRGKSLAGFLAEFTLDMNDFGLDFLKKNPTALGPKVHVTISLECVRQ